jgi:hypothetical protein
MERKPNSPTHIHLKEFLQPILITLSETKITEPQKAMDMLHRTWPIHRLSLLRTLLDTASTEGWLTPNTGPHDLSYGRLQKVGEHSANFSVDVVEMSHTGPEHTHPQGEVNLCLSLTGTPKFDGHPPGWVVFPPRSHHTPTVTDGRMRILYFLPGGEIQWGPKR